MKKNLLKTHKNKAFCIACACFLFAGSGMCLFLPKAEYSYMERRRLAAMPKLSADAVWNRRFMSDFESYAADQFPFRDSFRMLKAFAAGGLFFRQDNNGIYAAGGHLCAMEYPMDEASLRNAADRFRFICETYLSDSNHVYLSVIPDKNCFLAKGHGRLSMDYALFEEKMAAFSDFAQYISISDLLEKDDFYRTDPHWRQEKVTDVAKRLAQSMGAQPQEAQSIGAQSIGAQPRETGLFADTAEHTLELDFYGAYYGQAALPFAPDSISYLMNHTIETCSAYDWQNKKQIPVYDLEKAEGRDAYEMFLGGSLSLVTIDNPNAQSDKRLVLFRDSFGSSIAPLLVDEYQQVTLVDIRYLAPEMLGQFLDFEGCDVLFLYSTLVLNHSDTLK